MKIKALSLWQPWASLIAVGAKHYETRSWATNHRGPLLICASKGGLSNRDLMQLLLEPEFQTALWPLVPPYADKETSLLHRAKFIFNSLYFGRAVALVDLVDCQKCGPNAFQFADDRGMVAREKLFGDFSPGRYAWKLENVRHIEPFPVTGRQGLFEVEIPDGLI